MINIYGLRQTLEEIKPILSSTIHLCLCEHLGLPAGKKSQRFFSFEREDFYYPEGRSDAYILIEINLMAGRKKETLKALIGALFESIESGVGIAPVDVEIIIKQQEPYCWGFRGMCGDDANLDYTIKR